MTLSQNNYRFLFFLLTHALLYAIIIT